MTELIFFIGLPIVNEQTMKAELQATTAKVSWTPPTGDYDTLSIRQCEVETDVCIEHIVPESSFHITALELTVEPDVEYVYTMLLYQGDEVVLEAGPFIASKNYSHGGLLFLKHFKL